MEIVNRNVRIDVEKLTSLLLARKTTRSRFRWPFDAGRARDLLLSAYMAEVAHRHMSFVADPACEAMLLDAARALTADGGISGIMLCGTVGNGKTTLLRSFVAVTELLAGGRGRVSSVNATRLPALARDGGLFRELMSRDVLAVDDVGREPAEVLDYGNVLSPLSDLIEYRYDMQLFTVVATNLTPAEITGRYGPRTGDRCREMFRVIVAGGESYRGRKPGPTAHFPAPDGGQCQPCGENAAAGPKTAKFGKP